MVRLPELILVESCFFVVVFFFFFWCCCFLLFSQAEAIFCNVTVVDNATVTQALMVVKDLATSTERANTSIFPRDLNTSNYIITNTVDLLILNFNQGGTTNITAVCSLL